jgi:hypothetical protein
MTSTPEMYLALQKVYHDKSQVDLAECVEFLKSKIMPENVTMEQAIE